MTANSFDGVPERLRRGEEEATADIMDRYTRRLVGLARQRIDQKVARRVDADDIVQSVYKSFFLRQQAGQFELESWESLWALLARITVRKCGHQAEAQRAARRDVRREVAVSQLAGDETSSWDPPNRDPTPEEVVMLDETLTTLMSEFDSEKREMLVLLLQGHTAQEVSHQVGRTERSIYRLKERVRERLTAIEADSC